MPKKSSLQKEECILAHIWRAHRGREGTEANTEIEGGKCGCSHLGGHRGRKGTEANSVGGQREGNAGAPPVFLQCSL